MEFLRWQMKWSFDCSRLDRKFERWGIRLVSRWGDTSLFLLTGLLSLASPFPSFAGFPELPLKTAICFLAPLDDSSMYFVRIETASPSERGIFCSVFFGGFFFYLGGWGDLFVFSFRKHLSHCFGHITVLGSRIPRGPLSPSQYGADPWRKSLFCPISLRWRGSWLLLPRMLGSTLHQYTSLLVSAVRNV